MSDTLGPHGLYVTHQAPSSMGFSRQEYWSGLPFPSPLWNFFYLQLGFLERPSGSLFFSFRNSISFNFFPGQCVKLSLAFPDNRFVLQKGLFYFLLPQLKFKSCLKNFPVSYFVLFMFCIEYLIKITVTHANLIYFRNVKIFQCEEIVM